MSLQTRLSALITAIKGDYDALISSFNTALGGLDTRVMALESAGGGSEPIIFPLGGRFLLDPNEFNAWGSIGPYDDTNSQDLGNVGDTTPARAAGGICFPFDVEIQRFYMWHYNSSASAQAWGWRMLRQEKQDASNAQVSVDLLNEVTANAGVGPRDYGDTTTQLTDIDLSANAAIPAGQVIVLGVEAPTAPSTNYYVNVMAGYLEFTRV